MKNKSIPHIIWKHYIYFSKPLVVLYHQSYFQEIFFFFFCFFFFLFKIILYCLIQFSPCSLIFFPYILFNLPLLTFTSYYSICTGPSFSYFDLKKGLYSLYFFFFFFFFTFGGFFKITFTLFSLMIFFLLLFSKLWHQICIRYDIVLLKYYKFYYLKQFCLLYWTDLCWCMLFVINR